MAPSMTRFRGRWESRTAGGQAGVHLTKRGGGTVAVHEPGVGDRIGAEPGIAEDMRVVLEIGDRDAHVRLLLGDGRARIARELGEPDRFAELFEARQAAPWLEIVAQRWQVAVVPMH